MKKRVTIAVIAIIMGLLLAITLKWIKDDTSHLQVVSGGKTYDLVESFVYSDFLGALADGAWFPTSVRIFSWKAQELNAAEVIPYHEDMMVRYVSFFGTSDWKDQSFQIYDEQLTELGMSDAASFQNLPGGTYYMVAFAQWGLPFKYTGYQYIGKIQYSGKVQ
jgi:hypothetical protein